MITASIVHRIVAGYLAGVACGIFLTHIVGGSHDRLLAVGVVASVGLLVLCLSGFY